VNSGDSAATIRFTLLAGDGAELGTKALQLSPHSFRALTNAFDGLLSERSDELSVRFEVTPGAEVEIWASTIDNRTGDPVFLRPERAAD
jgi:hypothetical protein